MSIEKVDLDSLFYEYLWETVEEPQEGETIGTAKAVIGLTYEMRRTREALYGIENALQDIQYAINQK